MAKHLFQKGESGNPRGRPKSEIDYNHILFSKVTKEDWEAIVDKALEQAKEGNYKAREWLGDRLLGKAAQPLDISGGITVEQVWEVWGDENINSETSTSCPTGDI